MSRHKKAYDEDDLYDYDDYDDYDNYDESYAGGREIYSENDYPEYYGPDNGGKDIGNDTDYVQFVMESLGTVSNAPSGGRIVGSISEARVLQMLEAYDFDVEKTIDFFLKQRKASNAPIPVLATTAPSKNPVASKPNTGQVNYPDKAVTKSVTEGISVGKGISLPSSVNHTGAVAKKPSSSSTSAASVENAQSVQDLSGMGFDKEADIFREEAACQALKRDSIFDFEPKISAKFASTVTSANSFPNQAPASSLLTSQAPLSDDEYDELSTIDQGLPHITLVVAGHVDAGKSTLIGNLLYKVGNVSKRTMHKYEKESHETGKGSFALAWVMDESISEREHGVTIDIATRQLQTENRSFTVLDAPGHRDFIPNMISGATQADVALLVIPATTGEFEASMSDGAQTREHAVLLKALGVSEVVVVINKMDSVTPPWDQDRYLLIQRQMRALLRELKFPPKTVRFVPMSGLTGVNLVSPPAEDCPLSAWYHGPTLLQAMDSFSPPPRRFDAPLRAVITGVINEGAKGCEVSLSVLQGTMKAGRGVSLSSAGGAATVKKLSSDSATGPVAILVAGQKGSAQLIDRSDRSGAEMSLSEGMVLCKGPPLPTLTRRFRGMILTMTTLTPPIIPGSTFELYLHGEELLCTVTKIYSMTASSTVGESCTDMNGAGVGRSEDRSNSRCEKIRKPKCVPGGRCASVRIEVRQSICIEPFKVCRALGRFALRAKGKTSAVGICEKVSLKYV